jgi:hypothetical protein
VTALNADITNNSNARSRNGTIRGQDLNEFQEQGESSNRDLKE